MPTHVKMSINNFVGMLPEQPLAPFVQDFPILDIVKTNIQLRFKENIINLYFYYFNCRFTRSNSEMYWKTPIGHHTCAKNNCGIQIIVLFTKRKQHAILELTVLYNRVVFVKQYTPYMMQVIPERMLCSMFQITLPFIIKPSDTCSMSLIGQQHVNSFCKILNNVAMSKNNSH